MSIRFQAYPVALLGTAALLLLGTPSRADFSAEPPYYGPSTHFSEYEKKYAATTPAVVLYDRLSTEIHFSTDFFTRQYRDVMYVVFDARAAGDALDHVFHIPAGTKVKSLKAWSYTPGAAGLVWSKDDDMRSTKLAFGGRDVRVAVPGLAGKGLCGVRLALEWDGWSYISAEFSQRYPIVDASATVATLQVGNTNYGASPAAIFGSTFACLVRGRSLSKQAQDYNVMPDPTRGTNGPEWRWNFTDLPAIKPEAMARAEDMTSTGFYLIPRRHHDTWAGSQKAGEAIVGKRTLPAGFLREERDLLKAVGLKDMTFRGPGSELAVARVASLLDDPTHFVLLGGGRGPLYSGPPPLKLREDGRMEGTALDKAIVAHLMLNELGVTNFLTVGSSRYHNFLSLKLLDFTQFDAVLLRVPDAGAKYLCDIADRRVPLGHPGPDLYDEFLVMDPESDDPVALFTPPAGRKTESRHFRLTAAGEEEFRGTLRWRTEGPPSFDSDPWNPGEDLAKELNAVFDGHVELDSAAWQTSGRDSRAGAAAHAELSGSLRGRAARTGDELVELSLDLPGLPPELMEATSMPTRTYPLWLASAYEFADTIDVALPGAHWSSSVAPIELKNRAGQFTLRVTDSPEGVTLVRHLALAARLTPPNEYDLCRDLVQAWRRSETEPLALRPPKR